LIEKKVSELKKFHSSNGLAYFWRAKAKHTFSSIIFYVSRLPHALALFVSLGY